MVRIDRKQIHVRIGERLLPCSVRGRFFEDQADDPESKPVAVGDFVKVALEDEQGTIEQVLPRKTRVCRARPRDPRSWQVIAANVDLLVIVISMKHPEPKPGMVDRLLVVAESEGIEPVVVLNKADLVPIEEADLFAAPYRALGYAVLCTSATLGTGIDALRTSMLGRTAMLLGHSGVGKSSLITALDPTVPTRIGALINQGMKSVRGAHTTTAAWLYDLKFGPDSGAELVDTPGVREFGLEVMEPHDLAHYFRDLKPHIPQCKYATCTHDHEPSCGVKGAVERGEISSERYASYRKLLAELQGGGERMQRHDAY